MHIITPTLLIDRGKCLRNIEMMAARAKMYGVLLRPHFKTHQSRTIGGWFKDFGIEAITVSSVEMAVYFAEAGFEDITIAFPVNLPEIPRLDELTKNAEINCLVESVETAAALARGISREVGVFIKIDTGYNRTGILAEDTDRIDTLLDAIAGSTELRFRGFLTHAGHSYSAGSEQRILNVHRESVSKMRALKALFETRFPELEISVGDTPTCSLADDFTAVDEIRPGNFVFYDVMQRQFGSCTYEQIALALACPVVAKHADRNEIVVYGGAIHLSKDSVFDSDGARSYGRIVTFDSDGTGWGAPIEGARVSSLSQEHGILSLPRRVFEQTHIGEVIGILPIHACLTANCMETYCTLEGERIDHLSRRAR